MNLARYQAIWRSKAVLATATQTVSPRLFITLLSLGALLFDAKSTPAAAAASTREFIAHCDGVPEPCKQAMFGYLKFLVDAGLVNECILHQSSDALAKEIIDEMQKHPERGDEEWIDGIEDALKGLKPCGEQ